MRKVIITLIAISFLLPRNSHAQNDDNAAIAGAAIGALVGAAIQIHLLKEQVELEATQYILNNFPEYNRFSLETLDFNGKKLKDMSSTSVITFKMCEFDFDVNQKDRATTTPTILGERMVLFAFTSHGWVNEFGLDINRIQWYLISADEWLNMMTAYVKVASSEADEIKIKKTLKEGKVVNKGVRAKKSKDDIDFYMIGNDMYLVTDYSDKFKFVYNERSFGMYLKETQDLVQIGRNDLIKIHKFIFED
jgi:hypothetical protein